MSPEINHLYEFGDFRFYPKEMILMRGGEPVALTPKVFEMLFIFVENHGRLIEKDELMKKIWADNFVEESNLTFNIRQLRKALGDDAQKPNYIKTVPRHGYRFIATVHKIFEEKLLAGEENLPASESEARLEEPASAPVTNKVKEFFLQTVFRSPLPVALLSILLITSFTAASRFWRSDFFRSQTTAPILFADFKSEKLTNTGGVYQAVISPDGKLMAYSSEVNGKQSLWLRQFETLENIQLLPNSDEFYYGLSFSHDGQNLYFVRGKKTGSLTIYRVSVFGGIPKEVATGTQGWFSLSPDDSQISFVRCAYEDENYCSLFVDDSNGETERKILTRPRPIRIGDNQFAPDGKSIAFAVGQSDNSSNEFSLKEIDLESGAEREITRQKFFNINHLDWLPDKSGLLITAIEMYQRPSKIYQVSRSSGEVKDLTKDSIYYNHLTLDKSADKMVITQIVPDFRLWAAPVSNMNDAQIISYAKDGLVYTPSGKIVYDSAIDGNQNIWIMNGDGTEQRQLTTNQGANWNPVISPDEHFIYFASSRTGSKQVWRMSTDGSNQTQISDDEGGEPIFVTPDGSSVYYKTSLNLNLKKITIGRNGKFETQFVSNERMYSTAINSTGETVAYFSGKNEDAQAIVIMSLIDGKILKSFSPADENSRLLKIKWSKDNKYLYYLARNGLKSTIWRLSPETGKSELMTVMNDHEVVNFDFSPDGKSIAFICGTWKHDAYLIKGLK